VLKFVRKSYLYKKKKQKKTENFLGNDLMFRKEKAKEKQEKICIFFAGMESHKVFSHHGFSFPKISRTGGLFFLYSLISPPSPLPFSTISRKMTDPGIAQLLGQIISNLTSEKLENSCRKWGHENHYHDAEGRRYRQPSFHDPDSSVEEASRVSGIH
jgi:hypothetical protein